PLLLPLALAVSASPQTPKKTPVAGTGATVQALIALEDKWVDALQKADTETLNSILADTYVDTDEQGQQSDKQGILSALKSADLKFESVKVSDMQARTYDAAAVVTGTGVQRGTGTCMTRPKRSLSSGNITASSFLTASMRSRFAFSATPQ